MGIGGFFTHGLSATSDEVDELALAQERVDRLCAFTDLEEDTDFIPRTDRNHKITFDQGSLMCRDAKRAAWKIIERQRQMQELYAAEEERAKLETATSEEALEIMMTPVFKFCAFPEIMGVMKNHYNPSLDVHEPEDRARYMLECRKAKRTVVAIENGK